MPRLSMQVWPDSWDVRPEAHAVAMKTNTTIGATAGVSTNTASIDSSYRSNIWKKNICFAHHQLNCISASLVTSWKLCRTWGRVMYWCLLGRIMVITQLPARPFFSYHACSVDGANYAMQVPPSWAGADLAESMAQHVHQCHAFSRRWKRLLAHWT